MYICADVLYRFLPLNFRLFHSCLLFICVCLDDTYMLIEWSRSTQLCQFLEFPEMFALDYFLSLLICVCVDVSVCPGTRAAAERKEQTSDGQSPQLHDLYHLQNHLERGYDSFLPSPPSLSPSSYMCISPHLLHTFYKLMCVCLHIRKLSFCHNMRNWSLSYDKMQTHSTVQLYILNF